MLDRITPLILTYNEAPNIARTLEQLRWARDIVVVDSFSDDDTLALVADFPQARVFQRKFDSFAAQSNFGLRETGITTEWVLSMDADYVLTTEMVAELSSLAPESSVAGYRAHFTYCINGRRLRSGIYPSVTVLFRTSRGSYRDDGHAHRIVIDGEIGELKSRILHDDRKPLVRWFASQQNYAALEARKIVECRGAEMTLADRIRRMRVIAPFGMLLYCLIFRGGILDGWPGFYYALQRMLAELLLSLQLIEHDPSSARRRKRPVTSAEGSQETPRVAPSHLEIHRSSP
jgi:glycosyltransferase involved in cell wall biosynthesis